MKESAIVTPELKKKEYPEMAVMPPRSPSVTIHDVSVDTDKKADTTTNEDRAENEGMPPLPEPKSKKKK